MKLLGLLVILIILYIFHPWFILDKTLSSGDFPYLFLENIKELSFFPNAGFLWLVPYYQVTAKIFVEYLGLSWNFAEKILWFWPFLLISVFSSYYFSKKLFPDLKLSILSPFIFLTNTYVLMLVGGGQMGVAIAYSLVPLVLARFIKHIDNVVLSSQNIKYQISNIKYFLLTGLILAVQVMFDPRITYISMIAVILYLVLSIKYQVSKKDILNTCCLLLYTLVVPIVISIALNSFWIISLLRYGFPSGYEGNSSVSGFQFLSFADFSHTFSLLHPNWPENIFGKIYFLRSEFVLLPVLAYSSLLFFRIKAQNQAEQYTEQRRVLFFALLGLVGAFLAKGVNPPFGQVNQFLFEQIPGMNMFRDPTKFYLLTVLSYSVLIPYTVSSIYDLLKSKVKSQKSKIQFKIQNYLPSLFLIFTISYLLFLIRPAVFGQLGGTFKPHEVPYEYVQLKDFIDDQSSSFKTLWIPVKQRFGFSSSIHPSINANKLFNETSISDIVKQIEKKDSYEMLKKLSVQYVIVPYDSQKEIFLEDRKYDEKKHSLSIQKLQNLTWLEPISSFKEIAVFEVR